MINFNKTDYNLDEIEYFGKFSSMKTKKDYQILGLLQDDNPPIGIYYNMDQNQTNQIEEELNGFFKASGLELGFEHNEDNKFKICIREDIRKNVELATNLLKTIIMNLEGTLELDSGFRIPGLNKFVSTEKVSE